MYRRPPRSPLPDTLFPYTPLVRARGGRRCGFRLLPAASHGRSINRPPSFAPAAILRGGPEGGKPARQIAAPACAIPLASLRTPEGESSTVPSDTAQAHAVSTAPAAPLAPRRPQRHPLHGLPREDPSAWLS